VPELYRTRDNRRQVGYSIRSGGQLLGPTARGQGDHLLPWKYKVSQVSIGRSKYQYTFKKNSWLKVGMVTFVIAHLDPTMGMIELIVMLI
jgi:hypothetical protein